MDSWIELLGLATGPEEKTWPVDEPQQTEKVRTQIFLGFLRLNSSIRTGCIPYRGSNLTMINFT
jgi:hypothetical protein